MFYCVSSRELLLWPVASWNPYSFVRSNNDKWRPLLQKGQGSPTASASPQTFVPQLKQAGDCEQIKAEQWSPDAELYSVDSGRESHWGVVIKDRFGASESDATPARTEHSIDVLRDTIGQAGIDALQRSGGGIFPDTTPWLQKSPLESKFPRAVVYLGVDGGLHWILEERIPQDEWEVRTRGLKRGLKSRFETTTIPSITTTSPPGEPRSSGTSENNGRETFLIFLVLMIALPAGWVLHMAYIRARSKPRLSVPLSTNGSTPSRRDNGVLRTAEIIVEELNKSIQKTSPVGTDAIFHKATLEWAGQHYKSHLDLIPDGSAEGQLIAQSIQQRMFQEAFKTGDLREAGDLIDVGRNSREALRIICGLPLQAASFRVFQQSGKRPQERVLDLPKLLEQADTDLMAARKKITELQDWAKTNEREIAQSVLRQKVIEEREKEVKALQAEQEKLSQAKMRLETELREAASSNNKLNEKILLVKKLDNLARTYTEGTGKFLVQHGRIQAAAALGFLVDHSLFNLAQGVLSDDNERVSVMRENLRRISEKARNKGLAGFDPEIFGTTADLDVKFHHESDKHPVRPLFADTLKALRDFGDLHLHFDFDVDRAGVYRVG